MERRESVSSLNVASEEDSEIKQLHTVGSSLQDDKILKQRAFGGFYPTAKSQF
jgi:hypothetical protein